VAAKLIEIGAGCVEDRSSGGAPHRRPPMIVATLRRISPARRTASGG
jgi:hypothetical protein